MATLYGGAHGNTIGSDTALVFGSYSLWATPVNFIQSPRKPYFEKRYVEEKDFGKDFRKELGAREVNSEKCPYGEGRNFAVRLPLARRGDSKSALTESHPITDCQLPISDWSTSGGTLVLVNVKLMAKAVQQLKQIIIDKVIKQNFLCVYKLYSL